MVDFDVMLTHVGEFGTYQKLLCVFQAPFCIFVTFVAFSQLFILLYPRNYWCDQHFSCVTPFTNISAEQRRNISFRFRNGGIFLNDVCEVNRITPDFLQQLHDFDKTDECTRNRSAQCLFFANGFGSGSRGNSGSRWRGRRQTYYSQGYGNRRQFPETEKYGESETTTESGKLQGQWGGFPPAAGGGGGGASNDRVYVSANAGYRGPFNRFPENDQEQTSSRMAPAYGGWPQPECNEPHQRRTYMIGGNVRIMAESLRPNFDTRDRYGRIPRDCRVRWNRTVEIPYTTVVTEGNWWCSAEAYTTLAQGVFFVGAIVGGVLIGWIADTIGRVPALVLANVLGALGGALSAVSTNIWVFCVFRFIAGMAFDSCFTMMYILVLEFCGPKYRTLVANLSIAIFFTVGTTLLAVLAWGLGNWRLLTLVTSLPMLLALLSFFFVPESARWLISKGKTEKAVQILRKFAKVNRMKVDENIFIDFEVESNKLMRELKAEQDKEPSLLDAFRTPRLRRTFILLILFWSCIVVVYDGNNRNILNLANADQSVFFLFAVAASTEFPADILLIFTLDRFGRRWLAFISMCLSGFFSCLAAILTPDLRTPFITTVIIGAFFCNVGRNIGLQYAAELLPTVIRGQGVNTIHIAGYVAAIITPFIGAVGRTNPTLSLFLLGGFSIAAGILPLFLSETLGEDLPNTLEEAEKFGKDQSFWHCPICAPKAEDLSPEEEALKAPAPLTAVERSTSFRASRRGELYRSSMISSSSSGSRRNGSRRLRHYYSSASHKPGGPDSYAVEESNRRITN